MNEHELKVQVSNYGGQLEIYCSTCVSAVTPATYDSVTWTVFDVIRHQHLDKYRPVVFVFESLSPTGDVAVKCQACLTSMSPSNMQPHMSSRHPDKPYVMADVMAQN